MTKFFAILLFGLMFDAMAVVSLSRGLKQIPQPEQITVRAVVQVIKSGATSGKVLTGIFLEAIYFGALLYLLSKWDVTLVWPLTALGFVTSTLAAKMFLGEQVSVLRWSGVMLIVLGVALTSYSQQLKEKEQQPSLHPPVASNKS